MAEPNDNPKIMADPNKKNHSESDKKIERDLIVVGRIGEMDLLIAKSGGEVQVVSTGKGEQNNLLMTKDRQPSLVMRGEESTPKVTGECEHPYKVFVRTKQLGRNWRGHYQCPQCKYVSPEFIKRGNRKSKKRMRLGSATPHYLKKS